jgi:hypothetical protein
MVSIRSTELSKALGEYPDKKIVHCDEVESC